MNMLANLMESTSEQTAPSTLMQSTDALALGVQPNLEDVGSAIHASPAEVIMESTPVINRVENFRIMFEDGKLQILLESMYGGDIGNYIEYSPKTGFWELYEFNCSEPSLYHTHKDPVALIIMAQKELT